MSYNLKSILLRKDKLITLMEHLMKLDVKSVAKNIIVIRVILMVHFKMTYPMKEHSFMVLITSLRGF
jgi:hypothetical protein